jgi:uncharacterized metal-binding protein
MKLDPFSATAVGATLVVALVSTGQGPVSRTQGNHKGCPYAKRFMRRGWRVSAMDN